jgi:hypothetical protein
MEMSLKQSPILNLLPSLATSLNCCTTEYILDGMILVMQNFYIFTEIMSMMLPVMHSTFQFCNAIEHSLTIYI